MRGALAGAKRLLALTAGNAVALFARVVTAPRAIWAGIEPVPRQRIYFANHTSNGDFVLAWAVLPPALRERTRPVAAADYWLTSRARAFMGRDVFRAVLIDRNPDTRDEDPVTKMVEALDNGSSLILFPEGGRNMGPEALLPFKTGLYHVARERPDVDLVPTWIENLNQILPKGEVVPVPLLCTVTYGAPVHVSPGEDKDTFLRRAEASLIALRPENGE